MKKTKILLTRKLLQKDKEYIINELHKLVGDNFILVEPRTYTEDSIANEAKDANVLLGPYITKRILNEAEDLKLIQIPWTGMDTFNFNEMIDFDIPVCNSHSNSDAVAEMCLALIFDLTKKISYHDRKMRKGDWNRFQHPLDLSSQMIKNQNICIIGYGNIGRKTGILLNALGANIYAISKSNKEYPELCKNYINSNYNEALSVSKIVINTLPLTDETYHFINKEFLSLMQKGSFLVNVSRASIIDEDALFESLVNGQIAGFASDVWWSSPQRGETNSHVSDHNKFEALENIVFSPHRAGFVENSLPHLDDAIVNIANLINGKSLINQVDLSKQF